MAHDAFVSYSRADKETVDSICKALEENGINCWYAPRNVPIGTDWDDSILEALGASRVMILVWSAHSDQSRHVKREVALALDEMNVTVIPYRIDSIEPSKLRYYLSSIQWLDASLPPPEANLKFLVERVKAAIPVAGQIAASSEEQLERFRPASVETSWAHALGAEQKQPPLPVDKQTETDEESRLLHEVEAIQEAEAAALERAEAEAFRHAEAKARLRAEIEALQHANAETFPQIGLEALKQAREEALKRLETEAVQHAETKARLLAEVESLRLAAEGSLKRAGAAHKRG